MYVIVTLSYDAEKTPANYILLDTATRHVGMSDASSTFTLPRKRRASIAVPAGNGISEDLAMFIDQNVSDVAAGMLIRCQSSELHELAAKLSDVHMVFLQSDDGWFTLVDQTSSAY